MGPQRPSSLPSLSSIKPPLSVWHLSLLPRPSGRKGTLSHCDITGCLAQPVSPDLSVLELQEAGRTTFKSEEENRLQTEAPGPGLGFRRGPLDARRLPPRKAGLWPRAGLGAGGRGQENSWARQAGAASGPAEPRLAQTLWAAGRDLCVLTRVWEEEWILPSAGPSQQDNKASHEGQKPGSERTEHRARARWLWQSSASGSLPPLESGQGTCSGSVGPDSNPETPTSELATMSGPPILESPWGEGEGQRSQSPEPLSLVGCGRDQQHQGSSQPLSLSSRRWEAEPGGASPAAPRGT